MRDRYRIMTLSALPVSLILLAACSPKESAVPGSVDSGSGDGDVVVPAVPVTSELLNRRTNVEQMMFAAGEMQISGEPFTETFVGRNLDGYDRFKLPTDRYDPNQNPKTDDDIVDLFGFSTAVESYEYSKYHMNVVANQAGAGIALAHGPLVAAISPDKTVALRTRVQQLLVAAGSDVGGFAQVPAPADNGLNRLGFGGLIPTMIPWREFDPAAHPDGLVARGCSFDAGYGASATAVIVPDYECGYSSLHLADMFGQVTPEISPGAIGLAIWKEALWAIDFTGRLHDSQNNFVEKIAPSDLPNVGKATNQVKAADDGAAAGTYIGSSPLEGMWGLVMLDEIDNAAATLLGSYTTQDGTTLGGFGSPVDAVGYQGSPVRWFPTRITAQIAPPFEFPGAATPAISDALSNSTDLAALLLGGSMAFGMTDARNVAVGQSVGLSAAFDGDPFPADNGNPDGELTLHDRLLALLKVAYINLDLLHIDPASGVIVDHATVNAGSAVRDSKVSTTSLAHCIISLRQLLLSINGAITQYGGADPSPTLDTQGILNSTPFESPQKGTFSARVRAVATAQGQFVYDRLSDDSGKVRNFATLGADGGVALDEGPTTIEAQAAVVRSLIETFLLTEDEKYRVRARAVASRLETAFYAAGPALYRGIEGGADEITVTPETFGWLQSALRETYKVLATPGDPLLNRAKLEPRIARINKLFLNGWDDRNRDGKVDVATECLAGRLQLGEQALTGELGKEKDADTTDRDSDCVPEVDDAASLATLAASVRFHAP